MLIDKKYYFMKNKMEKDCSGNYYKICFLNIFYQTLFDKNIILWKIRWKWIAAVILEKIVEYLYKDFMRIFAKVIIYKTFHKKDYCSVYFTFF